MAFEIRGARRMVVGTALIMLVATASFHLGAQAPANSDGWRLPESAATEVNPIAATPARVASGKRVYREKCQRCHGQDGSGHGPDADPDHQPGDLTDGRKATRNPDGVLFYKVWNGRARPKMPAMKAEITRDEAWAVVAFVKTLRK